MYIFFAILAIFAIIAKIDGEMAKIFAIMAKFRHYSKNGEKMSTIFTIMAKIDGKMTKMARKCSPF